MRSDWWKFNESMTSGTRPPVRVEEGVRASDLGPSENQASVMSRCKNCLTISSFFFLISMFR